MKIQVPFYRNEYLINSSINVTFDDIIRMTTDEFSHWVEQLRQEVLYAWDVLGVPPTGGSKTESEIALDFSKLHNYDVAPFLEIDELTGEKDCLYNFSSLGSGANQFFSTMFKTKMNQGVPRLRKKRKTSEVIPDKKSSLSSYDYFADKKLFQRLYKQLYRNLKLDSYYKPRGFSTFALQNNPDSLVATSSGLEWLREWKKQGFLPYDVWIEEHKGRNGFTRIEQSHKVFHSINVSETKRLIKEKVLVPSEHLQNIKPINEYTNGQRFNIRYYEKHQSVLPKALDNSLRIGFQGSVASFQPLTARYLYEKYTEHLVPTKRQINIWDPSMGWGGRLLGALSMNDDLHVHYIGSDPNSDNWLTRHDSKYDRLMTFYNLKSSFSRRHLNTAEFYKVPAEDMNNEPSFKKYRGKVDVVLTSPPYGWREGYNTESTQSWIRYYDKDVTVWYDKWVEGFLQETLLTAIDYLRVKGFLIWNVADYNIGNMNFPIQYDSQEIVKQTKRMKLVQVYKMILAPASGANREHHFNGKSIVPTTKNYCRVRGEMRKYEPIYVWQKIK